MRNQTPANARSDRIRGGDDVVRLFIAQQVIVPIMRLASFVTVRSTMPWYGAWNVCRGPSSSPAAWTGAMLNEAGWLPSIEAMTSVLHL